MFSLNCYLIWCVIRPYLDDVDIMIEHYDQYLSDLLNKHAPTKHIYVVDRPLNEWMPDDIPTLNAIRRKMS